jgi:hypothetical protein
VRKTLVLILLVFALSSNAQPGGGGDPGEGEPVPISGIEILLASGALLGLRTVVRRTGKR